MIPVRTLRDHEQHGSVFRDRQQLLRRLDPGRPSARPRARRSPARSQQAARTDRGRPRMSGIGALPAKARTSARRTPDPASGRGATPGRRKVVSGIHAADSIPRRSASLRAQLGVVEGEAEPLAQQVAERPVRHRLAVRDAAAFEPQRLLGGSVENKPEKRLLPMPGSPLTKRIDLTPSATSAIACAAETSSRSRPTSNVSRPGGRTRARRSPGRPGTSSVFPFSFSAWRSPHASGARRRVSVSAPATRRRPVRRPASAPRR